MSQKIAQDATLQAIKETLQSFLNAQENTLKSAIGNLTSLSTSAKTSLVTAINELVSNRGALSGLSTSAKNTIVAAINEVLSKANTASNAIGSLPSLTTSKRANLVAAINEIDDRTQGLLLHNSSNHNAIFRGLNLGSVFTEEQSAAIRDGTFKGIYPGDSWTITAENYSWEDENGETQTASQTVKWRVGACDYWVNMGNENEAEAGITLDHHVLVFPDVPLYLYPMKKGDTPTTEGGYVGSDMYKYGLKRAGALAKACFGEDHILSHNVLLCNGVTDGLPSSYIWKRRTVDLMTEIMVYGSLIRGKAESEVMEKSQLPFFRHAHKLISPHSQAYYEGYWLRNIANETAFCRLTHQGRAARLNANVEWGVKPYCLIY